MSDTTQQPEGEVEEQVIDDYIEAAPDDVFDYVTDPQRRPFGRDDFLTLGEERAREAPARIEWDARWHGAADRPIPGSVEVLLTPDGTGTHVRVTHRFALAAPEARVRSLALAA
jgi:uncharacterized protein YndB with AHSA1/START domain